MRNGLVNHGQEIRTLASTETSTIDSEKQLSSPDLLHTRSSSLPSKLPQKHHARLTRATPSTTNATCPSIKTTPAHKSSKSRGLQCLQDLKPHLTSSVISPDSRDETNTHHSRRHTPIYQGHTRPLAQHTQRPLHAAPQKHAPITTADDESTARPANPASLKKPVTEV